ncbi:MAG TPA: hypothetical protein VJR23_01230, partial [Candidatus Acidoferrales bacterium]|nr:hypothetical protein [Candidatus Acidoferrales bacterium]
MNSGPDKIVVLEADAQSREALQSALQTVGYEVAAFATASEALNAVRQPGASLFFLDAGISSPGAREVLAEVRESASTSTV